MDGGGSSVKSRRSSGGDGLRPLSEDNNTLSSSKENRVVVVRDGRSYGMYVPSSTARLSSAASHISSSLRSRREQHGRPQRIYVNSRTMRAIRAEVDDLPLPASLSSVCLALRSSDGVLGAHADAPYSSSRLSHNNDDDDDGSMQRLEILGSFLSEMNFECSPERMNRRREEFRDACMSLASSGNAKLMTSWEEVLVGLSDAFLFAKLDVEGEPSSNIIASGRISPTATRNGSWKGRLNATKPLVKRAHRSSPKKARPESSHKRVLPNHPDGFLSIDLFREQIMNRMGRAKFLQIFQQGEVRDVPYLDEVATRLDAEIERRESERPSKLRADAVIATKEKADRERDARESAMKLMRPFTDEERAIVLEATRGIGSPTEILASQDADSVQRGSMQTLRPGQWLNDEVINYFLKNCLAKRDEIICTRQPGRKRSHFFNSFFVQTMFDEKNNHPDLRGRYNYKNVKRWSKKVPGKDIFNLKYILCPINLDNMHWTSAVIFMEEKRIQYYDSMGGTDRTKLKGLLEYVKDEYKTKNGGQEMDVSEWELVSCRADTPRQRNGFDCGVFTCMFCDFISKDCSLVFNQSHIDQCRDRIALSIIKNCAIE